MDEELMKFAIEDEKNTEDEAIILGEINIEDLERNIKTEEIIEVVEAEDAEEIAIEMEEAIGWVGGDSTRHYSLYGRDEFDQHPIKAISGLRDELDSIEALQIVYSNEKGSADYYVWKDENILAENRIGYFVSMCDDMRTIELCTGRDIFGVAVGSAAFVGGQDDVNRDYKYGLVAHSGAVRVRCELDVDVGDYVISNNYGFARKTTDNCGYRVIAIHNIDGITYAVISLSALGNQINALGESVDALETRIDEAEINIATAINAANEAHKLTGEIGKSNADTVQKVEGALGKLDEVVGSVGSLESFVASTNKIAVEAQAFANNAINSAVTMKNEAVETANRALDETVELKKELDAKVEQLGTNLDNSVLEIEAVKESINTTANDLQTQIDEAIQDIQNAEADFKDANDSLSKDLSDAKKDIEEGAKNLDETKKELKESIEQTVEDIESLEYDLIPLKTWPNGATGDAIKGIAGFVAKADEDSATLGNLVTWKNGTDDKSLAGFVSNATSENAHIKALSEYKYTDNSGQEHTSVAALNAYADDNKASIDAIVGKDGSLAGLQAQVDANKASVSTLASQTIGDYVTVDEWSNTDKNTATVYYVKNTKCYYYYKNNEWASTTDISEAGLDGAIAGVKSTADANKAELDAVASYEKDGKKGLAGLTAQVDENKTELATVATYEKDDKKGLAGLIAQVDANKAVVQTVAELDGGIAGLDARVEDNKSSIATLASQAIGNYITVDTWSSKDKNTDTIYYAKDTKDYYYYKNSKWNKTKNTYDAGLGGSIAGLQAQVDQNAASVATLASWSNNLHIGGRNLLTDSDREVTSPSSNSRPEFIQFADIAPIFDTYGLIEYTISFDIKSADISKRSEIQLYCQNGSGTKHSIGSKTIPVTTEYVRHHYTFTPKIQDEDETESKLAFYGEYGTGNIPFVKNVKLEKGNKATNWTPAPEDAVESIAGVKSIAKANQAQFDAMAAYDTKNNNVLAGMTAYVDANSAQISTLAKYDQKNADGKVIASGAAGLIAQVEANKSSIDMLAALEGDGYEGLAGLAAQVDANKSAVNLLSNRISGKYVVVSTYPEGNESQIGTLDTNKIYYTEHKYTENKEDKYVVRIWVYNSSNWTYIQSFGVFLSSEYKANLQKDTVYYFGSNIKQYIYWNGTSWKNTQDAYTAGLTAAVSGIQAVTDDNSASINSLTSWQGETNTAMARIEQKADANGAYIQSTVSNMDKYSVGPYSQAQGFTLDQAKAILEKGMVYVPTVTHSKETYNTSYNFTKNNIYTWSGETWMETIGKVVFSGTTPSGTAYPLWYTDSNTVSDGYEPYTLYKLYEFNEVDKWIPVATLAGNSQSRAVSQIRQDTNSIAAEVTDARGNVASLGLRLTNTESEVQSLALWSKGGNEDGEQYNLATIKQKADSASASITQVVESVGENGEITAASIVTAVNNDTSGVTINADHLSFNGKSFDLAIIDGVEIGNRNLLPDTDFNGESKRYEILPGKPSEGGLYFIPTVQIESGIDYTLSAKIRGKSHVVFYEINEGSNVSHLWITKENLSENENEYKSFSITFNVNTDNKFQKVYICTRYNVSTAGDWFEIAPNSLKLEKGNKATNWTPAPEDTVVSKKSIIASINASTEKITISANKIDIEGSVTFKGLSDKVDNSIASTAIEYALSKYSNKFEAVDGTVGQWSTTAPQWQEGSYMWQRTTIKYTGTKADTVTMTCIQGAKGEQGRSTSGVTNYYYATATDNELLPLTGTTSWKTKVSDLTNAFGETYKYLWNYEVVSYDDKTSSNPTTPTIIGVYSKDGNGINGIYEYYITTKTSAPPTSLPTVSSNNGWTKGGTNVTIPQTSADNPYLWNYEIIDYTTGTDSTSGPVCIGTYGNSIKAVTEYYAATTNNQPPNRYSSGTTINTSVWKTSLSSTEQSATKPYVWNFERTEYTIDDPKDTNVTLLTSTPRTIKTITEYYTTKSDNSTPTSPSFGTNDVNHNSAPTVPAEWDTVKREVSQGDSLWNCEIIQYAAVDANGRNLYEIVAPARIGYAGKDGTGVTIKGTAYIKDVTVSDDIIGDEYVLYSDANCNTQITNCADGDSYLVSGYLFVYCGHDYKFTCTGKIQGPAGQTGIGVSSVVNYYMASSRTSDVVAGDQGETVEEQWTTDTQSDYAKISASKPYLWNYEETIYTSSQKRNDITSPTIIGNYSKDGKGISNIEEFYCITSANSCSTPDDDTLDNAYNYTGSANADQWYTTSPPTDLTNKYLWNCERITYTEGNSTIFAPALIGTHGDSGNDAYTIILTNESHTFAGYNTSYATGNQTATTNIIAYKGATEANVKIISINGISAATSSTSTGITGLSFTCSTIGSSKSPSVTFTTGATTSDATRFSTTPCSIPIVVEVDGKQFTKTFSCSIALKGASGASATSYWLTASDSVIHNSLSSKSLTFTGHCKIGTSAVQNYAGRWIISGTTSGTDYTPIYTSTQDESIVTISDISSVYKVARCQLYASGGTTTLLDEQTIPVLSDGSSGTSVTAVTPMYCVSESKTTAPTTGWTESFDDVLETYYANKKTHSDKTYYIWSKEKVEYDSGDPTYSTATVNSANSKIASWCDENDTTVMNGSYIAAGSITADKIAANTITADQIATNALKSTNYKSGNDDSDIPTNPGSVTAGTFFDLSTGAIYSKNFCITGDYASFEGDISGASGTFTGDLSGSDITGGTININNNFIVDGNGNVTLAGAITWGEGKGISEVNGQIYIDAGMIEGKGITINLNNGTINCENNSNKFELDDYALTFDGRVFINGAAFYMDTTKKYHADFSCLTKFSYGAEFTSGVTITGGLTVDTFSIASLNLTDELSVPTLTVRGNATINNTLTVAGDISTTGNLSVNGMATVGQLYLDGYGKVSIDNGFLRVG